MIYKEPDKSNVCAVVITYYPDFDFPSRLKIITQQVDRVLIVDNNSSSECIDILDQLSKHPNVHLIKNESNLGVATALNQAVEWAQAQRCDWLLALDQDTIPYTYMVEKLLACLREVDNFDTVAIIGANYINRIFGDIYVNADNCGCSCMEVVSVITSGSLLSLSAAQNIGRFRDDYFIDHVDDEYSLRARLKGYKVMLSCEALMEHVICSPIHRKFLWKWLFSPNAPAFRRYYQARNHIALIIEYFWNEPKWILQSIQVRIKECLLILLLEDEKFGKMCQILQGIIDGVLGRMGPRKRDIYKIG